MSNLRNRRLAAGLTQLDLATRAGVSRQLVGAVEAGRHLPRVDAALALADALDTDVGTLFGPDSIPSNIVTGVTPRDGELVRAGRVGDRLVTAAPRMSRDGWDVADGVIVDGSLEPFMPSSTGFVVVGCEPGLELIERILREKGMTAVAATASSTAAVEALAAGRAHAAVVHGPAIGRHEQRDDLDVVQVHLTRWQVGLAAAADSSDGWWQVALSGTTAVVQREPGAGVQQAFESAVGTGRVVAGPRVSSHFQAAQQAALTTMPGVTIEPAAVAVGAQFHPLEAHSAQLWIDRRWRVEPPVVAALDVIAGQRFQRRLDAVGGYDLAGCGVEVR